MRFINSLCSLFLKLGFFAFFFSSPFVFGLEFGCRIKPSQAVEVTDRLIHAFWERAESAGVPRPILPDLIPISMELNQDLDLNSERNLEKNLDSNSESNQSIILYEALLRPRKSDRFSLLHLIQFNLERTRNLLYVCLYFNSNKPQESHLTLYFLEAYGLEHSTLARDEWSTLPGDWLFGLGGLFRSNESSVTQITRIPVELTPINLITNDLGDLTDQIPLLNKVLKLPTSVLGLSGLLLAKGTQLLGAGVERIVLTEKEIEFANRVNLVHPEKSNVIYRIPLDQSK